MQVACHAVRQVFVGTTSDCDRTMDVWSYAVERTVRSGVKSGFTDFEHSHSARCSRRYLE